MIDELRSWFRAQKRDFPWREKITPYRVWISEVMLQQTRAAVVIPYFLRWMERFPDVVTLAQAPEEDVVKCWEGLGYYSRARNLHKGAKRIVAEFGGEVPSCVEDLARIEGIGPYTLGAILSFAFQKKVPAVDGNVMRVLTRLLGIEKPIDLPATQKLLREKASAMLPDFRPWEISEGLIELGATLCNKNPACPICPLRKGCVAKAKNLQADLPKKRKKITITKLYRAVGLIESQGKFLIGQVAPGKVMEGLWEFPYLEVKSATFATATDWNLELIHKRDLIAVSHTFTRFKAHLFPSHFCGKGIQLEGFIWKSLQEIETLSLSSGHRRIFHQMVQGAHAPL